MKKNVRQFIARAIFFILLLVFVAKFQGPSLLRYYVESGMGDGRNHPIFSISPQEEIKDPAIDKEYILKLVQFSFPNIDISVPKNFTVIKETITKVYYKNKKREGKSDTIYMLYEEPEFFINLFPQARKIGIKSDYEFISRTMYAKTKDIKNLTDAFFSITKAIFTPDLGDQKNLRMVKFIVYDKKGFVTYNTGGSENYFDCNLVDSKNNFFKIYIKDKTATLDLSKVLAIISTVKKENKK